MTSVTTIVGENAATVVAKRIAMFEFAPSDNGPNRLHRQDAIKRRNSTNSSSASSISGSTISSSSDFEIPLDDFSTGTSSSELSEEGSCNGSSFATTTESSNSSGICGGSSDDYEMVSTVLENEKNGKIPKHKLSSTSKKKSLNKDCHRSLRHPFIPGHLQLVEFSEIQLDSLQSQEDNNNTVAVQEEGDEPFYEELYNYGSNKIESDASNEDDNEIEAEIESSIPEEEEYTAPLSSSDGENETLLSLSSEKDEETLECSKSSTSGSGSGQNESLYSEPMYEASVKKLATDNASTSSGHSYNPSTHSIHTLDNTPATIPNSDSFNSWKGFNLNNRDSWYDLAIPSAQLPPIPSSTSSTSAAASAAANKFSSIAKSAGKKLSKKLNYLRRLSRTSFDGSLLSNGSGSSEFYSTFSLNQSQIQSQSNNLSLASLENPINRESNQTPVKEVLVPKRSINGITRPNIPPPEPPRNPPNQPTCENGSIGAAISLPQTNGYYDDDMDDDDSDFYDSDSELIRNFVAAVQPIYSMEEEPLYQYYTYGISLQPENTNYQPVIPKNLGLTLDMLVPRTGQRTLWCELPEVISSGILSILSEQQKKLQEAIFEILTSEVSYLKSLDVLVMLFFENDTLIQLLTPEERSTLFGNVTYVKDCAQSFLSELLSKWEESWYIQDVGQVINDNANNKFHVYKEYCRNKPYQDKILQKLRNTNDEFVNTIKTIEEDSKCQLLGMDSFLMLPMQRITRLPLLVNAIIQRTQSPKEKAHCEDALKSLTNLVLECNEAAKESQDAEETAAIFEKLEFPKTAKSIPNPGQFVLKGDFMKNPFDSGRGQKINWTFQKNKKTFYWLLLFTNQLFITKKKSSGKFEVIDTMSPLDSNIKPLPNLEGISKDFQHFFMLHFDRNETVYFLAARTQSEVERWKQNLEQLKQQKDLKVQAVFLYEAKLKDELSFIVGDVILVSQTQPDGWYYGKKINTEESGWFPGNYCVEC